ncbi:MAG: ribonuclease III [Bdellovibrionales bacterium]|nr:ribonuclease III [Bdellovibrionales bacterium]
MSFGIPKKLRLKPAPTDAEDQIRSVGENEFAELERRLGYTFEKQDWLQYALTHRSAQGRASSQAKGSDYERLEFLGDAVLDLAVADLLLKHHGAAREGSLSKMRAALVNTHSLADLARKLDLGRFIILSKGELANGGNERDSILADVFESVIGAIYRDGGYNRAFERVTEFFGDAIEEVTPADPKTELQEVLHACGSEPPKYLLECVEGPEHAPTFVSVVEIDGEIAGRGRGATKKASQQQAASEALEVLRGKGMDEIDKELLESSESEDIGL